MLSCLKNICEVKFLNEVEEADFQFVKSDPNKNYSVLINVFFDEFDKHTSGFL